MPTIDNLPRTKLDYIDSSRPKEILEGEKLFNQLLGKRGKNSAQAVKIAQTIAKVIQQDPSVETLPERLNQAFGQENGFEPLGSDLKQLQTVLGIFYGAVNFIDRQSKTTVDLKNLKKDYAEAKRFIESQIFPNFDTQQQGPLARVMRTIDHRLEKVVKTFNEQLEKELMVGPRVY